MTFLLKELRLAVSLIFHGNPYLLDTLWFTVQVVLVATAVAAAVGVPLGLALALERFPGRRLLNLLANAGLALPPVLAGLVLFLLFVPQGPLGALRLELTRRAVFVAQSVLALPYVVALTAAAVQGLRPGLVAQARAFGARRPQRYALALREARIGVLAALIAAMGTALAEVGAVVIVGGNVYGYDQTLASASLFEADAAHFADALAFGLVLIVLILVLLGSLGALQQSGEGVQMRLRPGR